MFTLLQGGEVYGPEYKGVADVLLAGKQIAAIGTVDHRALETTGLPLEVIDTTNCFVVPGLIDPHEHLLGEAERKAFRARRRRLLYVKL